MQQLLLLLHCLALAALADAGSKWGPDNPKPWVLKYQKYIGPFMAMCVHRVCEQGHGLPGLKGACFRFAIGVLQISCHNVCWRDEGA